MESEKNEARIKNSKIPKFHTSSSGQWQKPLTGGHRLINSSIVYRFFYSQDKKRRSQIFLSPLFVRLSRILWDFCENLTSFFFNELWRNSFFARVHIVHVCSWDFFRIANTLQVYLS